MGKKRMKKLFEEFQEDMGMLEGFLRENRVINGGRDLSFSEKAAVLRNIEAENRTHLAWTRTWAAVAALIVALAVVYLKF